MTRHIVICTLLVVVALPGAAAAQGRLTLADAVQKARERNPRVGSAAASEGEASARVTEAQAGHWPKVDLVESWARGNAPVFVFSSLLSQRQFTAANFAVESLNHPAAVDNFRTAFTIEQPLLDFSTRASVAAARIGRSMAAAGRTVVDHDLATRVTAAYTQVLVAAAGHRSAVAAGATARADRELAANRRDAGLVTDADVLQLDLHVSRTRELEIRTAAEERVARAQLNALVGEPLDARFSLDPSSDAVEINTGNISALEKEAVESRPDLEIANLQEQLALTARASARAAFLPQVSAQAGWEVNGGTFASRESSWAVGAVARINLFDGFAKKARLAEADEQAKRRALERQDAETAVRLDVRSAVARLDAARASVDVARSAVTQAAESRRIIRDRYESGLADVTSLLRSAEAIVQAEAQQVAAEAAVLAEAASLRRAVGRR